MKISVLPKLTYKFNTVSIKITKTDYKELDKLILKLTWKRNARTARETMKKKNYEKGLALPDNKT